MKINCPVCWGRGTGGDLHGPRSVGTGDSIMVQSYSERVGTTFVKVLVTEFVHSGYKLINDGRYTIEWPDGKTETRRCGGGDGLSKVCLRCDGAKEIEPTERDDFILDTSRDFIVSGKGTARCAKDEDGLWWKFRLPIIGRADLLTDGAGKVYRPDGFPKMVEGSYQSFRMEYAGTTDVSEDVPQFCDTHGWYEEASCPECP